MMIIRYNNMRIENNRIIFKDFEEFEIINNKVIFPLKITEIELNLMDDDYECILYIDNHIEVCKLIIDDVNISKDICIVNNLNEILLVETILIKFHYNNSLIQMAIKTNIKEEKKWNIAKNKSNSEILEEIKPITFSKPLKEIIHIIDESENTTNEIKDIGYAVNFDEDFDDLI